MDFTGCMICLFGICSIANWLDRKKHGGKQLFYTPGIGWMGMLHLGWMLATLVGAVLFWFKLISSPVFIGICIGYVIACNLYFIWRRHKQQLPSVA